MLTSLDCVLLSFFIFFSARDHTLQISANYLTNNLLCLVPRDITCWVYLLLWLGCFSRQIRNFPWFLKVKLVLVLQLGFLYLTFEDQNKVAFVYEVWWWSSSSGDLGCVEWLFFAITPRYLLGFHWLVKSIRLKITYIR